MLYCAISTVRSPINIIKAHQSVGFIIDYWPVGFIIVYYSGN